MILPASFRAGLILAVFPVVAGVATGALLLAEWKFAATCQRLFEEQFESHITAATEARQQRFETLAAALERFAAQPGGARGHGAWRCRVRHGPAQGSVGGIGHEPAAE